MNKKKIALVITTSTIIATTFLSVAQALESNGSDYVRQQPTPQGTTGDETQQELRFRKIDAKNLPSRPREEYEKKEMMEKSLGSDEIEKLKNATIEQRATLQQEIKELQGERKEAMSTFKEKAQMLRERDQEIKRSLENATPEEREKIQMEIKARQEKIREEGKEIRREFRAKITDVKERVRRIKAHNHARALVQRFHAAVTRLTHLTDRTESRLKKMSEEGVNVASLTTQLDDIKKLILVIEEKTNTLKTTYESLIGSDNPQEVIAGGKKLVEELKTNIQDIHEKLRQLVADMKNLTKK